MKLTKEQLNKNWAVTWSDRYPTVATDLLFSKLFEVAFAKCQVFSEVGVGCKPTTIGEEGYLQWISSDVWAMKSLHAVDPIDIFRYIPPGRTINVIVFHREIEADCFIEEIEKRIMWIVLGG
jgi:hypothetical protein